MFKVTKILKIQFPVDTYSNVQGIFTIQYVDADSILPLADYLGEYQAEENLYLIPLWESRAKVLDIKTTTKLVGGNSILRWIIKLMLKMLRTLFRIKSFQNYTEKFKIQKVIND